QTGVDLDPDAAVSLVVKARVLEQVASLMMRVIDDTLGPRDDERARPGAEPTDDRNLRARAEAKAVPVPVLGDDAVARRQRRDDGGKRRRHAERDITLVPVLKAGERIEEAGLLRVTPFQESVARVDVDVEQPRVVDVRTCPGKSNVVVGVAEVPLAEGPLLHCAPA